LCLHPIERCAQLVLERLEVLNLQGAGKSLHKRRSALDGVSAQRMRPTAAANHATCRAPGAGGAHGTGCAGTPAAHCAARRTGPAGVSAARLDRAVTVLSERAALRVLDTELGYSAAVGDDLADPIRSFADVDHQIADAETRHGSPRLWIIHPTWQEHVTPRSRNGQSRAPA
jgi:hypothetical protein